MKILVVSDSHGYLDYIHRAIAIEQPDRLIHLGDHSRDADQIKNDFPTLPIVVVKGNCDFYDPCTPECADLSYRDVKIFATHGHMYNVKSSLLRLYMAAKEKAVHVALFGHTHCAMCEMNNDVWLMNPGSCGINSTGPYGIVEIVEGSLSCSLRSVADKE